MSLTLSAIAVGAVKCAAAGGCLSVVQYINTSRTLANQNKLAAEGREHSAKLQKLQQEFQEKLQERNFVETERLQREIVALQHLNAMALLDKNFAKQWDLYQNQVYLDKAWPLLLPPMHYLEQLRRRELSNRLPLQIIVPTSQNDPFQLQITRIGSLLCSLHGSDVFFFDGAWKPGMGVQSAQMFDLQNNLGGCPTIVVKPDFVDNKFIIKIAYWGMGDLNAAEPRILTELPLRDVNLNALRQFADEKADLYRNETAPDPYNKLISLREEEKQTYDSYIKQHKADADVTPNKLSLKVAEYCNDKYRERYNSFSRLFEANILDIRNHCFEAFIGVAATVMSDMHRMLGNHEIPKGVSLGASFKYINESSWLSLMANTYMDILEHMSQDVFFELPLYYSLIASAFNGVSGGGDYAKGFAEAGWKCLEELYANDETKLVKAAFHKDAFEKLDCIVANRSELTLAKSEAPTPNSLFKREQSHLIVVHHSETNYVR